LRALILAALLITSTVCLFSEDLVTENPLEDSLPFFIDEHFYFKIGTSTPTYQTIGVGKRWNHFETLRGNDFSINFTVSPLIKLFLSQDRDIKRNIGVISAEYIRLFYQPLNPEKNYYKYGGFGLGLGLGSIMVHRKRWFTPMPIPNLKTVWGKEYQNGRFSQWSCNIIPTVLFCVCALENLCAYSSSTRSYIPPSYSLILGGAMFEYSFGF